MVHGRSVWRTGVSIAGWPSSARALAGRQMRRLASAVAVEADDRQLVGLLLMPFFLMAFAIATNQSFKPWPSQPPLAQRLPPALALDPVAPPPVAIAVSRGPGSLAPVVRAGDPARSIVTPPRETIGDAAPALEVARPGLPPAGELAEVTSAPPALATAGVGATARAVSPAALAPARAAPPPVATAGPEPPPVAEGSPETAIALALPVLVRPAPPPLIESRPAESAEEGQPAMCRGEETPALPRVATTAPWRSGDARQWAATGDRLAQAAAAQLGKLVIYNDAYRRISYPMGDVPQLYGVCTDVIIRAYRALGIDLQADVQRARLGSGDTSIDHRRTETLRRLFARHGESLPVTSFAESYRPGDVVTYHRPQNRRSRSHIAIVSSEIGPSGRPMIIHNRGWGPQIEDALFADQITGHYRYGGLGTAVAGGTSSASAGTPPAAIPKEEAPVVKAAFTTARRIATTVSRRER